MVYVLDPEGAEPRALHRLVDFQDKDILEIGCGDGRLTWRYADHAASVLAIDPKEGEIALAEEHTPEHLRSTVKFQIADIATLAPPEAAFDIAIFSWPIRCIPSEGVADALDQLHRSLRPNGVVLDVHPRPEHSRVEVWVDGKSTECGNLNESSLIQSINATQLNLASAIWDGYLVHEETRHFEFLYHFDSVDACESYLAEEWRDCEVDPALMSRARELLANKEGETVIREPMQAARLRRS